MLFNSGNIKPQLTERTRMVDGKYKYFEREKLNTASFTSFTSNRRIKEGMRCSLQRDTDRESVVRKRTSFSHKLPRTFSNKTCNSDIYENVRDKILPSSSRQQGSSSISPENASLRMCQLSKEIWEHLMHLKITITAEYCRVLWIQWQIGNLGM